MPVRRDYTKIRQQEAEKASPNHTWSWVANYHAVCERCGLDLHVLLYQATSRDANRGLKKDTRGTGYLTKLVWGGNEYGIGGALKEPPCRG